MAFDDELMVRLPRQRGQGAAEAIIALPGFLFLVCFIFQFFLLGIAQVQLQYAAFYAARVGAVRNNDSREMEFAVKTILGQFPGSGFQQKGGFQIEILETGDQIKSEKNFQPFKAAVLKVQVHWHYPLIVPIANSIMRSRTPVFDLKKPTFHLRASWAIPSFGVAEESENHGSNQRT